MNFFDRESPLGRLLGSLGDTIALNLFWILGCLPIVTIGASSAALYATARELTEGRCSGVFRAYRESFLANFKRATAAFLLLVAVGSILLADVLFLLGGALPLGVTALTTIPVVVFILCAGYVFPLQSRFDRTLRGTLFNSLIMGLVHLPTSFATAALNLLPAVWLIMFPYSFFKALPFWLLAGFSLTAMVNTLLFNRVFRRYSLQNIS